MIRSTCLLMIFLAGVSTAAEPEVIDLWPGKPPAEEGTFPAEADTTKPDGGMVAGKRVIRLGNVTKPQLAVYRPAADKDTGAAMIICPGGGYSILAWDLEGTEVAEWLNSIGVTGVVLKYRVPRRPNAEKDAPPVQPLQDAQRAVSYVRSKAADWKLDPARIGILGFSAGGNLAARTALGFEKRSYDAIDDVDKASCRPDFAVLVYPAYLVNKENTQLRPEITIPKNAPPTFLAHAGDDPIAPENSALLYLALKQAKVPAELHIYTKGGHGYGLRRTEAAVTTWPDRCQLWLQVRGILATKK